MADISLIAATLGRTECLPPLLESLAAQEFSGFELIVVDQNKDDRLVAVLAPYLGRLDIKHVRTSQRGLSRARNIGLARSKGHIVGFPDDDCLYPPTVTRHVAERFRADPTLAFLSGPAISPQGALGSGRWQTRSGPVTMYNVWTTVIGFNFFMRRETIERLHGFDENLGVGTKFGSAEETDLAIRTIRSGAKALYDYTLRVAHPDKRLTPEATGRAFSYGAGLGRVLRKHPTPRSITAAFFVRPVGGIIVSVLRARKLAASYYWRTVHGRVSGYLAS